MKSVNELLDGLAKELLELRKSCDGYCSIEEDFDKAQQLVGQIRWKLKEEQWKPR